MCEQNEAVQALNEWIAENQSRITDAVLAAFSRIDGVSEAMTDIGVLGAERVRQKIVGLITAAHAVLPEFIGEAFAHEFSEVTDPLAPSLKTATEAIAANRRAEFIDLLIQRHGL